jgi:enediyne biosynthesis protein E4
MPFGEVRPRVAKESGLSSPSIRCLLLTVLLAACLLGCSGGASETTPSACARVTCGAGAVCSEADGLCHCATPEGLVCVPGQRCGRVSGTLCEPDVEPVCTAGTRWAPGVQAFREATSAWGLDAIGAEGVLLSVTDLDGDGWADLLVRRGGTRSDVFDPDEPVRHHWVLRNTGLGTFEDVTEASGLLATRSLYEAPLGRPAELMASADVDNDGDLDIYTGLTNADPMVSRRETAEVMLNAGDGAFAFGPTDNPVRREGQLEAASGATFVDFDRDGFIDLLVTHINTTEPGTGRVRFLQDRLYRGDGTGRFVDVTDEVGLGTEDWVEIPVLNEGRAHSRAWASAACDLDGDGLSELLVASYGRAPNHLWQAVLVPGDEGGGEGAVRFENRSVASGYAYDDDLTWTDNEFARCYCQSDRSAEGCADVPPPRIQCSPNWSHDQDREPFRLGGNSATTTCADFNNDGHLDLITGEIRHAWAGSGADGSEILVNTGESPVRFERPGNEATGLAIAHRVAFWDEGHMTNAVLDFDNDGWLDLYQGASDYPGNRGLLYHQAAPLSFVEVPPALGVDHNRSHGVVAADFDRDGDLDLIVGHSRARCDATAPNDCYATAQIRFFENVLGDRGNWLQLVLEGGPGTNRAAIGARVSVTAGGFTQTREVGGGHGLYGTQGDLVQHVGLGAACEAEVTVRWPNAALTTETFTLAAGHRYHVVEGRGATLVP